MALAAEDPMATEIWAIGLVVLGTFLGAGGPVLLKKASQYLTRTSFFSVTAFFASTAGNSKLLGGLGLYAIGFFCYILGLRGGELSVLYPLNSLSYVWVGFYSNWFLHERFNLLKISGIALVILGSILVGLGS